VLWSLLYLVVRNLFALVFLFGRSRRSNELEILVLRHELAVLRRQAGRPRLTRADRVLLAALSRSVPRTVWPSFPVKPETLLRWHRELVARRWTCPGSAPGRPSLDSSLRTLILRLARENPHWGYRRIVGELNGVGIAVSATSVRKVLLEAGLQPVPERGLSSWRAFLRAQAASIFACDFLTVETAFLQRIYVLFLSRSRRGGSSTSLARRTRTDAGSPSRRATSLCDSATSSRSGFSSTIATRSSAMPSTRFFRTGGIRVIRTPVRAPNANAYAERWVRTVRADCLDRILIVGRRHLEHVLCVYHRHYNEHRPHRALRLLPPDGRDPAPLAATRHLRRRDLLGGDPRI
jgi:transposase InsO family protein